MDVLWNKSCGRKEGTKGGKEVAAVEYANQIIIIINQLLKLNNKFNQEL